MSKEEEAKLLYGMLFSLKSFSAKLSPVDMKQGFTSYKTNVYRLSLYETPSSLKFVLNTDNEASQQEVRSHKSYFLFSQSFSDPGAAVWPVLPGLCRVCLQVPDAGAGGDDHQQPVQNQAGPVHEGVQHLQTDVIQ